MKKPTENRVTLSQRMDQLDQRFNRLEAIVIDGFKQVNTRLDYIVQANNLKDIK